ncbi:hypothetical protein [Actinoplanes sp. NBRC 101535]|uniref:hypothetical protein n=1 Tax=Actinoplanes sp. NBRC 101535 TaxID=3032196 RepID=UPI0024A5E7B2|nr:hypothetical protein [Actinoplanes sp. NBRC 101535]GLX99751.1 hypothetical protein Acsp01_01310 [Actinoplanes sp. NBRC 101535]
MPPEGEIGSEFHWDPAALLGAERGGLPGWLPDRRELFATGCGALTALLRRVRPAGRVHIPSFFCTGVAHVLSQRVRIAWYRHLPDGRGPHWETLRPAEGDMVLAQNLFGREPGEPWRAWMRAHPRIPVIEDHSHDPFGEWSRTSAAAYAVASLRKTLPLPDGGLLWSPRGMPLPAPTGPESHGAHLKLAAMLLKTAWLEGRTVDRDGFRQLQVQGEQELLGSEGPASAFTRAALPALDVTGLRATGERRARELAQALDLPSGGPFRVQLFCRDRAGRDGLLSHLARNGIFAPVHWRQDRTAFWSGDPMAADAADRILTLPVDHRCSSADVRRIAEVTRAFMPVVNAGVA